MHLSRFIASGFLSGFAPKAPGTVGTVAFWLISILIHAAFPFIFEEWRIATAVLISIVGTMAVRQALTAEASKDPQWIVIDEWAGLATAYCFIPDQSFSLLASGLAFLLFRVFDISKLWPISRLEALPGATGIMADDIAAGVFAGLVIQILCLTSLNCL